MAEYRVVEGSIIMLKKTVGEITWSRKYNFIVQICQGSRVTTFLR
jgi:hypothetical protein